MASSGNALTGGGGMHDTWTIERLLRWMQTTFAERHIESARLDAELLVAQTLGVNRTYLYTHSDQPLTTAEREVLRALVKRRLRREPMAYIRGVREFYGRDFTVGPEVLVPRPETEHIVETVLTYVRCGPALAAPRILDVGTGSGALAVTLAAELPHATVVATDVSAAALAIARQNGERLGVSERLRFYQGDLFAALPADEAEPFDIIVSNPPYIALGERPTLSPDVRDYEPSLALFAGDDGLQILRPLCAQMPRYLAPTGLFVTEMGHTQADAVLQLVRAAGSWTRCELLRDLQELPRLVVAERRA